MHSFMFQLLASAGVAGMNASSACDLHLRIVAANESINVLAVPLTDGVAEPERMM